MGGLWVANTDRTLTPPGALRHAQGLSNIRVGTLKSRRGSTQLSTFPPTGLYSTSVPHSLYRFNGATYAGVGNFIYRDGVPFITILDGGRLAFVKAQRTVGVGDLLYVAGGGNLLKFDTSGFQLPWGVQQAPDGFLANKLAYKTRNVPLSAMGLTSTSEDSVSTQEIFGGAIDFTTFGDGSPSSLGDYLVLYLSALRPQNIDSIQIAFIASGPLLTSRPYFLRKFTVALPSSGDSAAADVQTGLSSDTRPQPVSTGGVSLTPIEDIAAFQRFLTSGFSAGQLTHSATRQRRLVGTDRYGVPVYTYVEAPKTIVGGLSNLIVTPSTLDPPGDNWVALLIPKNTFVATPDTAGNLPSWNAIEGVRVTLQQSSNNTDPAKITVSPLPAIPGVGLGVMSMVGGSPIFGTVKYRITQVDDVSGAEGNPNPAYLDVILGQQPEVLSIMGNLAVGMSNVDTTATLVDATGFNPTGGKIRIDDEYMLYTGVAANTLTGITRGADISQIVAHSANAVVQFITEPTAFSVNRHPVQLTRLPTPDSGTHLRLYRTLGNQEILFKLTDLIAGETPNYDAGAGTFLDDYADFAILENPPHVVGTKEILFDNIAPVGTYDDAVGPHLGRIWWARNDVDGERHRLYYSPPGRWESVANFIEITQSDDPIQKLVIWQGQLFAFTKFHIIAIGGDTEPFSFQQVAGAPGTVQPFAVVPTSAGIFYIARDGLRVFNGVQSALAGFDAIGPLFRGESAEDLSPFVPIVGAFARDELWLSDTEQTLVFNINGTWRRWAYGTNSFFYDESVNDLLGGLVKPDTDPLTGTIWAIERVNAITDADSPIAIDWQTGSIAPSVDATQLVQRLYVYASCNGQVLTPSLILDDDEIVLPTFTGATPRNFEFSVNRDARLVAVRFQGNIVQPIEIARIEIDVDIPGQQ